LDMLDSDQGIGNNVVDGLEIIESELVGTFLCVHLDAVDNQEFVECLSGETIQTRCQLHPIIENFILREMV